MTNDRLPLNNFCLFGLLVNLPRVVTQPFLHKGCAFGIREVVEKRRDDVVAVSPIIAGAALKGPADDMLTALGHESSAVGIARIYSDLAGTLVIDEADAALAPEVEAEGMRCVVTPTIMSSPERSAALARTILAALPGAPR